MSKKMDSEAISVEIALETPLFKALRVNQTYLFGDTSKVGGRLYVSRTLNRMPYAVP